MLVYEFYCSHYHIVLSFLSKTVNALKQPGCLKYKKANLQREVFMFVETGKAKSWIL